MLSTVEVAGKRAGDATFLGQPRGLFYLAFTEAWERFSFYGMTALVVLYMVNQLLLPGHVEHIGGFSGFRAALESLVGPLSTQALASQIFGLYSGLVYFTPLLGGMIADRWIGQRNAVVIGALSMSAGHIAMTFDQSFLLASAAARRRLGFFEGQYFGASRCSLSARGRSAADPRFRHLQHGNQHRSGRWTLALRFARTALWLALRLRHRRDLHASRACHLSLRISLPAGARGTTQVRERYSTHCNRAAHHRRPHRRDDHLDLRVNRLRSNLQREFDLDSTARRARHGRLPDPGAMVPIDQFGFQHRERAAAVLDLAATGIARSRA